MAESVSDADVQAVKPQPKRRRILDPSAIVPVPIYSNKVSSSLRLKPMTPESIEKDNKDDGTDDSLWSSLPSEERTAAIITLSDSEDDEVEHMKSKAKDNKLQEIRSPSPPPPESPVQKQSRQVKKKISEIDRRLQAVNSLLSPEHQGRTRSRRCRSLMVEEEQDDDVIIMSPNSDSLSSSYSSSIREIPLKIRCRTDVHKIHVLSSTPLSDVLAQLSVIIKVPPPRILLLKDAVELPTDATVSELGLGIADIIDCVVMTAEDKNKSTAADSVISVRLQSKDRDSSQEFSLSKDAPLGSIFSQYLSKMSPSAQRKVRFHFDGSKVVHSQTPAQLEMEDGDIIEVWI